MPQYILCIRSAVVGLSRSHAGSGELLSIDWSFRFKVANSGLVIRSGAKGFTVLVA